MVAVSGSRLAGRGSVPCGDVTTLSPLLKTISVDETAGAFRNASRSAAGGPGRAICPGRGRGGLGRWLQAPAGDGCAAGGVRADACGALCSGDGSTRSSRAAQVGSHQL